jgi:hypothetical protein
VLLPLPPAAGHTSDKLAKLTHLDFLRATVTPPPQDGHTTYGFERSPKVGVLWTYAEPGADGAFRRVGGGGYDQTTDTWGQGAFNADDISRAAVVYLRHWRQSGAASSRSAAYELLRGLTYLQTATGPDTGNVVLWMQPSGLLNPSAEPAELPDPSDSGPSYWLARTVWALGEGYAAFRAADPAFAAFLRNRMDLSVAALDRQVLTRYGKHHVIDGERTPAWLIVDGTDATAEAVLGLAAYVEAGGSTQARRALARFAEGIAALSPGARSSGARHWPFGGIRPWALSRSLWHAWGSQMPAALARAGQVLGDRALLPPAVQDSAMFTPWLLTSGGPDNGRLPAPNDRTQIAYGIDSRVQSLLATAEAANRPGLRRLAAITAAWYFGANAAGVAAYDPATGRTVDGIAADGTVNRNAGAESTIHGLLSMLALDADPELAGLARSARIVSRLGATTVEAESGRLAAGARAVTPPSAWTGESSFSGGAYALLPAGSTITWELPARGEAHLVMPIADLQPGSRANSTWRSDGIRLGRIDHGAIGPQGLSPAPGALLPVTLSRELPGGTSTLEVTATGGDAVVDALLLEPVVSRYVISGDGHTTTLLRNATESTRTTDVPGAVAESYDRHGILRARGAADDVQVLPGGFTIIDS